MFIRVYAVLFNLSGYSLNIRNIDPKFQINQTKNNFAKGQKQKSMAKCCQSAKFGGAQAKQGRAIATLFLNSSEILDLRSLGSMDSLGLSPF